MAKLALINREAKRAKMVAKFAAKRAELLAVINNAGLSDEDRALTQLICAETDRIRNLVDRMEVFGDERPLATANGSAGPRVVGREELVSGMGSPGSVWGKPAWTAAGWWCRPAVPASRLTPCAMWATAPLVRWAMPWPPRPATSAPRLGRRSAALPSH